MTPRPYQVPGIEKAVGALPKHGAYLLADEPGVGKTPTTCFIAKKLGWPVAVVCPKAVIPAWKKTLEAIGVPYLFVENPELILHRQKWGVKKPKKDLHWQWKLPQRCLLVFDELHRYTGDDSILSHMLAFAPKPFLGLSATAADKAEKLRPILHAYNISRWDDWSQFLIKSGMKFNKYAGGWYLDDEAKLDASLRRVHQQLFEEKGSRLRKAELPAGTFPDSQTELVPVTVDDPAKIDEAYALYLEQLASEAPNNAVYGIRARQTAELQKLPSIESMAKDWLEEGLSVCIFLNFSHSLDYLRKRFPDASLVYGTDTQGRAQKADDRQRHIDRFQANQTRTILCMTTAGGIGIDLHDVHGGHPRGSLICPTNYSAIDLIQVMGRTPRDGAKTPCIQRLLFAADTIEEQVMRKIEQKQNNLGLLNDSDLSPLTNPNT